jgi:hypothetical protein
MPKPATYPKAMNRGEENIDLGGAAARRRVGLPGARPASRLCATLWRVRRRGGQR